VQIGFWPVTDDQATPTLWEETRQAILAEFNGVDRPRVGFWMENLAASRPAPGQDPVAGTPNTNFAAPLYLSSTSGWANFQALTSWTHPFNNYDSKVTNAVAADGLQYAYATFGSTYAELYVDDVDNTNNRASLRAWNAFYFPPERCAIGPAAGGIGLQWPSWTGGQYRVDRSTDLHAWSNCAALAATSNLTLWTDSAPAPAASYRVRTTP
jgi:hypothetical protein